MHGYVEVGDVGVTAFVQKDVVGFEIAVESVGGTKSDDQNCSPMHDLL